MISRFLVAISLALVGCGGAPRAFQPAERATARTEQGFVAADYEIGTSEGPLGDARVFTRGAFRSEVQGQVRTLVHVGFIIENNSNEPIDLPVESLTLESASLDGGTLQQLPPTRVEGTQRVPAGREGRIDVYFALPEGVGPRDVDAFRVGWEVRSREESYSQRTPFLEQEERYYYTPDYDPFYYDPFLRRPWLTAYPGPHQR